MKATGIKREKMCRHFGQKMMLTAERCASPKCAFTRRGYPPGAHGNKRKMRRRSGYGEQLLEKQRARVLYGVSERVFKQAVRGALEHSHTLVENRNVLDLIAGDLERRLDNAVFRLGFAPSRAIARQLVSHGHILLNGRRTTVPSAALRIGDKISIRTESAGKQPFTELAKVLAKHRTPAWLALDVTTLSGTVNGVPTREDMQTTIDLAKIVEFYAR